jgi:hypothetical protein
MVSRGGLRHLLVLGLLLLVCLHPQVRVPSSINGMQATAAVGEPGSPPPALDITRAALHSIGESAARCCASLKPAPWEASLAARNGGRELRWEPCWGHCRAYSYAVWEWLHTLNRSGFEILG